jgi:hypothetical protein
MPAGSAGAQDEAATRLFDWLVEAGGRVGPIGVAAAGCGRGVFARSAISAGETLLELPRACLITPELAARSAVGRALADDWRGPAHNHMLLASLLLGADDRHAPYLASLPGRLPGLPLFYTAEEQARLEGTALAPMLAQRRAELVDEVAWLHANAGMAALRTSQWFRARALVASRVFYLGDEEEALVPLADLLNHAPEPEVVWELCGGRFVLRAVRAVAAGEELHHCYGATANARLLLNYGFTVADNPVRDCVVDLPGFGQLNLDDSLASPAMQAMQARLGEEGRAQLAEVCCDRLARLPEIEDAELVDLRRVVADERHVLSMWLRVCG